MNGSHLNKLGWKWKDLSDNEVSELDGILKFKCRSQIMLSNITLQGCDKICSSVV